jgi:phosphoribosylformylglycinamidine synthase PurS subunit
MTYVVRISVMLKDGIADPQGQTIQRALPALGYSNMSDVRVGKRIDLAVDAQSEHEARARAEDLCKRLLANPVLESFEVSIA